jgi:methylmalonyl-CoA/ethylmalonyl-CoA epimerase
LFKGLDHIAIAVPDAEEALKLWRDRFGFQVLVREIVNDGATLLVHLDLGNTHLQLVQPLDPGHHLAEWLAQHGPGLHHFCLAVEDVEAAGQELAQAGLSPAQPRPHQGVQGKRALFLDPVATGGIRVELTGG